MKLRQAELSVFVHSIYLFILGGLELVIPNQVLPLFGLPQTNEPWIRIAGMLLLAFAGLYFLAAKYKNNFLLRFSAYERIYASITIAVLIVLKLAPVNIFFAAIVDFSSAIWTFWGLSKELVPNPAQ